MKEHLQTSWLIARRELVDQLRDWRILFPMMTLILILPFLMTFFTDVVVGFVNQYGASLVAERIRPFMLLVAGFFPVTVSLVVALESFVGEKERGTMEPILSSPVADWQIYMGKLIAGSLFPLTAGYVSIILFLLSLWMRGQSLIDWGIVGQIAVLNGIQAILMVSVAIVISTQSTSVRAANLLASFIVIPVGLLLQAESYLIFWGNSAVLWWAGLALMILSVLFIRLGLSHFQREKLLGREIDMLNLGWLAGTFWREFSGGDTAPAVWQWLRRPATTTTLWQAIGQDARGLLGWYRNEIGQTLRKMAPILSIVLILGVATFTVTYLYVDSRLPDQAYSPEQLRRVASTFGSGGIPAAQAGNQTQLNSLISFGGIFRQNVRSTLVIGLGSIVSFGVVGVLGYLANISAVGALLAAVKLIGLTPAHVFVVGILPHGIFELPALWIAIATALFVSARLVTPENHLSIGEVFIDALADWVKIYLGVCLPLLFIAALVESTITLALVMRFLN